MSQILNTICKELQKDYGATEESRPIQIGVTKFGAFAEELIIRAAPDIYASAHISDEEFIIYKSFTDDIRIKLSDPDSLQKIKTTFKNQLRAKIRESLAKERERIEEANRQLKNAQTSTKELMQADQVLRHLPA